jgi:hypothetical protein
MPASNGLVLKNHFNKENFMFAAPAYIPLLIVDFENEVLKKYTPCILIQGSMSRI